ncbi:MAG: carbamoyl-phosphate synthase (glutamine-hydrolyzing) large subunit [Gemmatimonadales bacterium]
MTPVRSFARPARVLLLGSGALQIGQAGEFDYSGTQALKALKEEGVFTVLVNPNIATIQTSEGLADRVYFVAITPDNVEQILEREECDAILLGFGGQTGLNCGLELDRRGVFARLGVRVLGTPVATIRDTEDRALFKARLDEIQVKSPRSVACTSLAEARAAVREIGLPAMLRVAFALGGRGSAVILTESEIEPALKRSFDGGIKQVLVEEYLAGWKEIEVEVVRDAEDNCITVCAMENFDPMGIHTGESIVVAPTQTLNDEEVQLLRTMAIDVIRHLGIVGECNIQYALDPASTDYRVIEVNARLSRSSALASKATGYPLAYVAAKIALGFTLPEIPNGITKKTTAFFEPALDYIVCKFPRWDLGKFRGVSTRIGSEMKSVGEVMAIGRTFPEVLQRAVRMLDIGALGVDPEFFAGDDVREALRVPTSMRVFAIARALADGITPEEIHTLTGIDAWFIHGISEIITMRGELGAVAGTEAATHSVREGNGAVSPDLLRRAKQLGFSDHGIGRLSGLPADAVRTMRISHGIIPRLARIDTLAAEFPAETNYLYPSYHATENESPPSTRKKILVLGSGSYRIGSSVEFDWCCVSAVRAAAELGYETLMLNYNPETVSTDWDECDRLVFDEVSFESVLDLWESERPEAVVVSMGGQVPNNLALRLARAGVKILGTSAESIDMAEDRRKFSGLLDQLGVDQPAWTHLTGRSDATQAIETLGGYPVLVRPSYVLSGAAMSVAHDPVELDRILERARTVSPEHPVVVTKFETGAREIEIDAIADKGQIVLWAICEHVEDAGVHSGDATLMLPPQTVPLPVIHRARKIAVQLAESLAITGPFNLQLLVKHGRVRVIEVNLRASRSLPFVSKVIGTNFVREAIRRMLGVRDPVQNRALDLDYVAVKVPQFSFPRLVGADPILGVEMASTGEVGCFGDDGDEALLQGLAATGFRIPKLGVLLSLGPPSEKYSFLEEARALSEELGLSLYATAGTAGALQAQGIRCTALSKTPGEGRSGMDVIDEGLVDLVINVPRSYDELGRPDGYLIRRRAVDAEVPLITDLMLATALVTALRNRANVPVPIRSWEDYLGRQPRHLA